MMEIRRNNDKNVRKIMKIERLKEEEKEEELRRRRIKKKKN